jgi:glycosyltransferase involved in cell wall biosynthesis
MRLLVVNFEMNEKSAALAWQAQVVRALAQRCEHVAVLTDHLGRHAAADNVSVEQLARPAFPPLLERRAAQLGQTWRACRRHRVDAVFIHMAHRYAFLLWPVFRARRLPTLLWYAHGTVTWHLRLAHACVDRVVSSSPEGFRLPSHKAYFIGQGVDTDLFGLRSGRSQPPSGRELISVGRISRRKRQHLLLDVLEQLKPEGYHLTLVGVPLTSDDRNYDLNLRDRAARDGLPVTFAGLVPLAEIPPFYDRVALHLNVSQTNSMDKAVLEALACGCPVLTTNPAFRALLAGSPEMIIGDEAPASIAAQVRALCQGAVRPGLAPERLRALIFGQHDLHSYAGRIMSHLEALRRGPARSDRPAEAPSRR